MYFTCYYPIDIFFDYLTVYEHLKYMMEIKGIKSDQQQISTLINKIGLVEKQGALCFMLIDDANRLSDNFEHIFTEYCGPSPFSSSESKKGCLLPLFLIFGVFFSGAVAGCKLFA